MASIISKVNIIVSMDVCHPEEYTRQSIRLAARGALRNALFAVENSKDGFNQHPLAADEAVCIELDEVEFD